MKLAAVLCIALGLLTHDACAQGVGDMPVAAIDQWLTARMAEASGGPPAGPYRFMVALTTGHMRRDPVHSNAMRRAFAVWLNQSMAPGDTVQVAAAERNVWSLTNPVTLSPGDSREQVFSGLPTGPEPRSRGGKDLEAILADLAEHASSVRGPVVLAVLSNSWTQTDDKQPDGPSQAERLKRLGCSEVRRAVFSVPDGGYRRDVYVAGCAVGGHFGGPTGAGAAPRRRFSPDTWVPEAYRPTQPPTASTIISTTGPPSRSPGPSPWAVGLGATVLLASVGGGAVLARRRARGQVPSAAPPAPPMPALEPGPASAEPAAGEVSQLLEDASKHAKVLGVLRDGMTDSVDKLDALVTAAQSGEELGRLRTEVAGLSRQITDWDKSAIDYLDAVQAALSMAGLDESRRQAWKRAGDAFIRLAQRQGLSVIAPQPGEPYIEGLHKATEIRGDRRRATVVAACVTWGYQNGSRLYRPAEVIVCAPDNLGSAEEQQ